MDYVREVLSRKLEENEEEGRCMQRELIVLKEELITANKVRAKVLVTHIEILEQDYLTVSQSCIELRMALNSLSGLK